MANIIGTSASNEKLALVLEGILTDLTALKTAVDALATKLNTDTAVGDTDYATSATLVTTNS